VVSLLALVAGVAYAAATYVFLPDSEIRLPLTAGLLLLGLAGFGLVHIVSTKLTKRRAGQLIVPLILIALVLAPPLSMLWPGTITWATFGFTLYGAIPVPALDVIVNQDGILWFREKTHRITLDEVVRITGDGSDVEVLVIGTGWDQVATVEPEVLALPEIRVMILRTKEAFDLFNQLKKEGKRVVLFAHTTC
jgi:hypothetical protein